MLQTLAQCEARAHRIGQKSPVVCRYLLAKGTADDYIWEMVKRKQDVLNRAGIFSEDLSDAAFSVASHTVSVIFSLHFSFSLKLREYSKFLIIARIFNFLSSQAKRSPITSMNQLPEFKAI